MSELYEKQKSKIENYSDNIEDLFKLLIDLQELFLIDEICCTENGEGFIKENRYLKTLDNNNCEIKCNNVRILSVLSKSINNLIAILSIDIVQNKEINPNMNKINLTNNMNFRKLKYCITDLSVMYENLIDTLDAYNLIHTNKNIYNKYCLSEKINDEDLNDRFYKIQGLEEYEPLVEYFNKELSYYHKKDFIYKISYIKQKMHDYQLKKRLEDINLKVKKHENLDLKDLLILQNSLRNLHSHKIVTEYTGSSDVNFNRRFYEVFFNILLNINLIIIKTIIKELYERYVLKSWIYNDNLQSSINKWMKGNSLKSEIDLCKIDELFLLLVIKYSIDYEASHDKSKRNILESLSSQLWRPFLFFNKIDYETNSVKSIFEQIFKDNEIKIDKYIKFLMNLLNKHYKNDICYHYRQIHNNIHLNNIKKLSSITGENYIELLNDYIKKRQFVDIDIAMNFLHEKVKDYISQEDFRKYQNTISQIYEILIRNRYDIDYDKLSNFDTATIEQVAEFEEVPVENLLYDYIIWYKLSDNNKKIGEEFISANLLDKKNYFLIKDKAIKEKKELLSGTYINTLDDKLFKDSRSLSKYGSLLLSYYFYDINNL